MHRRFLVCLLALAPLGVAVPAFAQSPKPARGAPSAATKPKDHADELFEQATAALDGGRLADAERLLLEAWSLKQTHDIAGNLGLVEVKLGKVDAGAQHIAWALEHFPPTESDAARRALEQELVRARAKVGALRIRVSIPGAEVTVNGSPVSALPDELFVLPGTVTVGASREGYVSVSQSLTIAAGAETRQVTLTLVPVVAPPPARSVVPGAVLGALGGVALISGAALVGSAGSKRSTVQSGYQSILQAHHSCVAGAANFDPQCSNITNLATTSDTFDRVGVGLLIGGGAAAVASVTYFLWPKSKPTSPALGRLRVVPTASTDGGGLLMSGAF